MKYSKQFSGITVFRVLAVFLAGFCACNSTPGHKESGGSVILADRNGSDDSRQDEPAKVSVILVVPRSPAPGESFRIVSAGGKEILKGELTLSGADEGKPGVKKITSDSSPVWRIDEFNGLPEGKYEAVLRTGGAVKARLGFVVRKAVSASASGVVWKTERSWDASDELLYSAWINALFNGFGEDASWTALHEVTRNREHNFLYNYLSAGEDDPENRSTVFMQPDCADNPFFLRAYFSWKLGLPFGFHLCDRGYVNHSPRPGDWITNSTGSRQTDPVQAFNIFLRRVADGVHSGTARTALNDERSDYYPVSLDRRSLRPGTVYADPYGHTLVITGWVEQTRSEPGLLLAVDAQPDGTVGMKRFWKGNFLFNTKDVVGEPGFKAFRPVRFNKGEYSLAGNSELIAADGYIPPSVIQKKMDSDVFYHTIERLINPRPLDPESAMLDLIQALHEQLQVRVTSVTNGEEWFRSHPGSVIPMPSNASGIFLAGGQWENFSTPNRDLRLLIAIDAVLSFPDKVAADPGDYRISGTDSAGDIKKELQSLLKKKGAELSISYTRSDGTEKKLSLSEILERRSAFEMAYNPNDGVEIRWGAPEGSDERSTCRRHAPAGQYQTMLSVRKWFASRLHPPT